jgi:site-specific DNA-cytosine methylase
MDDPLDVVSVAASCACHGHGHADATAGSASDPLAAISLVDTASDTWVARYLQKMRSVSPEGVSQLLRLAGRSLKYGDDCSGARAVLRSLADIVAGFSRQLGVDVVVDDRFASEHPGPQGDAPRFFLTLNTSPAVLFTDMTRRKMVKVQGPDGTKLALSGADVYTGSSVTMEHVDVYVAGYVCKDLSTMNNHQKALAASPGDPRAGASSHTLHASLLYITTHQPKIVILENVFNRKALVVFLEILNKQLRPHGYLFHVFVLNSLNFHMSSRTRIWAIGVNTRKVTVLKTLRDWGEILAGLAQSLEGRFKAEELLLPDGDPYVQDVFEHLTSVAEKRPVTRLSVGGQGWKTGFLQHQSVRRRLAKEYKVPVPSIASFRTASKSKWLNIAPAREADVMHLHTFAAELINVDVRASCLFWDTSLSIRFPRKKNLNESGRMPCMLCDHIIRRSSDGRVITGLELMRWQGFDGVLLSLSDAHDDDATALAGRLDALKASLGRKKLLGVQDGSLKDCSLRKLAGDTMSVPVAGALVLCALAFLDLDRGRAGYVPKQKYEVQIVGSMRTEFPSTELDTLPFDMGAGASRASTNMGAGASRARYPTNMGAGASRASTNMDAGASRA